LARKRRAWGQVVDLAPLLFRTLLTAAALALTGCATFDFAGNREALLDRAKSEGWQTQRLAFEPFALLTLARGEPAGSTTLTIYIEGDGLAWLDRTTPSSDPTPLRPVGLRLALADPAPNILYLARPCQYLGISKPGECNLRYWTSHRYAEDVVVALNDAIERRKQRIRAQDVELIGYSGGGVIAALIAGRRTDVVRIVTVAANLDLAAWTKTLGVDAMPASLDPAREIDRIKATPQYHLVGTDDESVPPSVVRSYVSRNARPSNMRVIEEVKDYDHDCCWHRDWVARITAIRGRPAG